MCIFVAVLAMIAAVVFIVIDPASKRVAERNAQRWTDVTLLMEGVQTDFAQTKGELTEDLQGIDADAQTVQVITNGAADIVCSSSCGAEQVAKTDCKVNFSQLANDGFIAAVPADPSAKNNGTDYYINYDEGVFTVGACGAEQEKNGSTPTIRLSQ